MQIVMLKCTHMHNWLHPMHNTSEVSNRRRVQHCIQHTLCFLQPCMSEHRPHGLHMTCDLLCGFCSTLYSPCCTLFTTLLGAFVTS